MALTSGLRGREVNLGGIHAAEGRLPVLPYLALGTPEREAIASLLEAGVQVMARDLPASRGVEGTELLGLSGPG
jgi:mannose/fructose/N-acetylgalactosamine-specific phosphotransferase system component IIB